MATLTRAQVKNIIDSRPKGTEPRQVVEGLLSRGHQLEGYDPELKPDISSSTPFENPEYNAKVNSLRLEYSNTGAVPSAVKTILGAINPANFVSNTAKGIKAGAEIAQKTGMKIEMTPGGNEARDKDVQYLNSKGLTPNSEWSDQEVSRAASAQGLLSGDSLRDFGVGALKELGETALGGAELVARGASAVNRAIGLPAASQEELGAMTKFKEDITKPSNKAEELGKQTMAIGEFILPAGLVGKGVKAIDTALDAAKLPGWIAQMAKLGARAGLEGGSSAGVAALQEGEINQDVIATGLFGGAIPIAGSLIKGLGKASGEVAKHLSSTLSGVPKASLEYAFKNPVAVQTAVTKAIQEGGDVAAQRIRGNALEAMKTLKNARTKAYQEGLEELEKSLMKTQKGTLYIKNTAGLWEPVDLTTKGVKDTATRVVKEFGGKAKGRVLDFSEMAIDKSHANKLQEIVNRIYDWDNVSPTGMDRLRQIVDSYKVGGVNLGSSEKQFNAIVGKLRTNLSNYVGEKVPQIAALNKQYATQSEVIDGVMSQLKLGSKDPNTALRKLVNVFNPKSQVYRPIVEELGEKAGVDLMSDIAGLTMSQWTPEGLGKYLTSTLAGTGAAATLVNPAALVTVPAAAVAGSPRVVGGIARAAGRASKLKAPKTVGTVAKGALLQGVGQE